MLLIKGGTKPASWKSYGEGQGLSWPGHYYLNVVIIGLEYPQAVILPVHRRGSDFLPFPSLPTCRTAILLAVGLGWRTSCRNWIITENMLCKSQGFWYKLFTASHIIINFFCEHATSKQPTPAPRKSNAKYWTVWEQDWVPKNKIDLLPVFEEFQRCQDFWHDSAQLKLMGVLPLTLMGTGFNFFGSNILLWIMTTRKILLPVFKWPSHVINLYLI